jgi:hypothetical protein
MPYSFTPIETVTSESINSMFSVNAVGLMLATKAALSLLPAGGPKPKEQCSV